MKKSKVTTNNKTKSNNLNNKQMKKSKAKVSVCQSKVEAAKVPTDPKAILTVYQVAKLLGVTAYQVYALEIKDRKLSSVQKLKAKIKK